jgi:hypothetical protein
MFPHIERSGRMSPRLAAAFFCAARHPLDLAPRNGLGLRLAQAAIDHADSDPLVPGIQLVVVEGQQPGIAVTLHDLLLRSLLADGGRLPEGVEVCPYTRSHGSVRSHRRRRLNRTCSADHSICRL